MYVSHAFEARRRRVLIAAGAYLFGCSQSYAQQAAKAWKVGFLGNSSATLEASLVDAFREGLRSLGYTESTLEVEFRWADGKNERLQELAADLVRAKAAVIVTGGTPGTLAAQRSGPGTPIVMIGVGDPVGAGLIASLARPGGNVTGIATLARELEAKRLEFLSQLTPKVNRVAVLMNPSNPFTPLSLAAINPAAAALGMVLVPAEIRSADQIDPAFRALQASQADALILIADRFLLAHRTQIVGLALKSKLAGIFPFAEFAQEGGLMSYAANLPEMYRRAATFVDRILKGGNAGEIPVEQPTKFELIINQRTAKALNIRVPQTLLVRADKVIN